MGKIEDIPIEEIRGALLTLLKQQGLSHDSIISTILLLKNEKQAMFEMASWIYDRKPDQTRILAMAISDKS